MNIYLLYCGFYFEYLDINIAIFFSKIKDYNNKSDYKKDLIKSVEGISHDISKVNKFKVNYHKPKVQCAFSAFRSYRCNENKKLKKGQNIKEYQENEV